MNPNSLIANGVAVSSPQTKFYNWYAKDSQGKNLVFFHQNPENKKTRELSKINAIVFHETAGWGNKPGESPGAAWTNGTSAAHFRILPNGNILQHYDINRNLRHAATGYNDFSIGIEFTNVVWTNNAVGTMQPVSKHPTFNDDPSPRKVIETWWKNYVVPPHNQLLSLYKLVLLLKPIIGNNLDFDEEKSWKCYNYKGISGNFQLSHWESSLIAANKKKLGFYAHINIYPSHSDGWFQNLYMFLRCVRMFGAVASYNLAISLIEQEKKLIKVPETLVGI